jgi:hypothetical protein
VTAAEMNDRGRVELALRQLAEVLSEAELAEVRAAAQAVLDAGHTAAELAEDLEEGLALFTGAASIQ